MPSLGFITHITLVLLYLLLANLVLLLALLIKPFSDSLSWALGSWTAARLWGWMQRHFESNLNALPAIHLSGDDIPAEEAAIVLSVGLKRDSVS